MKTQTKKKVAIAAALIVGVVATIVAVTRAKAAPPEYALEEGTWDAEMPFEVNSMQYFTMGLKNISDRRYDCDLRMELYSGGGSARWGGSVGPGNSMSLRTNWYMPPNPGIYDMTLEITIDGVFIGAFVVSKVEVL